MTRMTVILAFFLCLNSLIFSGNLYAGKVEAMYCRPGEGLTMYYLQSKNGHRVNITFKKANHNVLQNLQPGECMWKSHPMWGDEPQIMTYQKDHTYGYMTQYTVTVNEMRLSGHNDIDYTTKYFFDYVHSGRRFKICGEVGESKITLGVAGVSYKRVIHVKSAGAEANCQ